MTINVQQLLLLLSMALSVVLVVFSAVLRKLVRRRVIGDPDAIEEAARHRMAHLLATVTVMFFMGPSIVCSVADIFLDIPDTLVSASGFTILCFAVPGLPIIVAALIARLAWRIGNARWDEGPPQ